MSLNRSAPGATSPNPDNGETGARSVIRFIAVVCIVEAASGPMIAPLLPHLLVQLHLSDGMAGELTSAFWIGGIIGVIPPLVLIERTGPRSMAVCGLIVIAVSLLGFGLAGSVATLMAARLLGGAGAAAAWAGAYTWLLMGTPAKNRGTAFATVFTASYVGLLLGPVFGAAAADLGRELVCTSLACLLIPLALWGQRLPAARGSLTESRRWGGLMAPRVVHGMLLMAILGAAGGAILVIAPLRLAHAGAGAGAIAAVLWAAYVPGIAFSRTSGRILDRFGPSLVVMTGMVTALTFLPLLAVADVVWLLAVSVSAVVLSTGVAMVPAMVMVGAEAEHAGLHVGPAFALAGGAWGVGSVAGSNLGGWAAQGLGFTGEAATVAAPCVIALGLGVWRRTVERREATPVS